jgi:hypothetical protein
MPDFVSYTPENGQLLLLTSLYRSRVLKSPVKPFFAPRKEWAGLVGMIADGHHVFKVLIQKILHTLGVMVRDVNRNLGHDPNGQGVDPRGLGSSTVRLETVTRKGIHKSLCHVGACGIVGTDKEDFPLFSQFFHITFRAIAKNPGPKGGCHNPFLSWRGGRAEGDVAISLF